MTQRKINIGINAPHTSIWGTVQHREKLAEGVYEVDTARHGGIMVHHSVADKYLSEKVKVAFSGRLEYGWYHFEEDCNWAVFAHENKKIIPKRFKDNPEKWNEIAEASLKMWHPEFL